MLPSVCGGHLRRDGEPVEEVVLAAMVGGGGPVALVSQEEDHVKRRTGRKLMGERPDELQVDVPFFEIDVVDPG